MSIDEKALEAAIAWYWRAGAISENIPRGCIREYLANLPKAAKAPVMGASAACATAADAAGSATRKDAGPEASATHQPVGTPMPFLIESRDTLTNICQLLSGWHQDGTAWSEWDTTVYDAAKKLLKECYWLIENFPPTLKREAAQPDVDYREALRRIANGEEDPMDIAHMALQHGTPPKQEYVSRRALMEAIYVGFERPRPRRQELPKEACEDIAIEMEAHFDIRGRT